MSASVHWLDICVMDVTNRKLFIEESRLETMQCDYKKLNRLIEAFVAQSDTFEFVSLYVRTLFSWCINTREYVQL